MLGTNGVTVRFGKRVLYEDVNGDMNLQSNNLDFQTGNMNFDFNIKRRNY